MPKQTRTQQVRLSKEQSARYENESELPFSGARAPEIGHDPKAVADLLTRSVYQRDTTPQDDAPNGPA